MTSPTHRLPDYVQSFAGGTLQILALGDSAFRVRFQPQSTAAVPASLILASSPAPSTIERTETGDKVRLRLAGISCEVAADGCLQFFDRNGSHLLSEAANGRRLTQVKFGDDVVYIADQTFESPADEHLYGTGCFQDGALDLRAWPRRLTQVNTQISLPFVLSSRGYGLLWHNRGMAS